MVSPRYRRLVTGSIGVLAALIALALATAIRSGSPDAPPSSRAGTAVDSSQPPLAFGPAASPTSSANPAASPRLSTTQAPPLGRGRRDAVRFEPNVGQFGDGVRFLARSAHGLTALTDTGLVLTPPPAARARPIRLTFEGAHARPTFEPDDQLPGRANYLRLDDLTAGHRNVPTYARVHARGLYPGIDAVFYGRDEALEYDLHLATGANPSAVVLTVEADAARVDPDGTVVATRDGVTVVQHTPVAWQDIDGVRQEVLARFEALGDRRFGLRVDVYDSTRPLVVDPVITTTLAGNALDQVFALTTDSTRAVYVAGRTNSASFPVVNGVQTAPGGGLCGDAPARYTCFDGFVTKLASDGRTIVSSSYFGANRDDSISALAVDEAHNIYFLAALQGRPDCPGGPTAICSYAGKLSADGASLAYLTRLDVSARVMTVSGSGLMYFGAERTLWRLSADGAAIEAFATVAPQSLGTVSVEALATDTLGNVHAAGSIDAWFPTSPGAFQPFAGATIVRRSFDRGVTTERTYRGVPSPASPVVFDPDDATRVYVATSTGLAYSGSAGEAWADARLLTPPPAHVGEPVRASTPFVDPETSDVYVAFDCGLYVSHDRGVTLEQIPNLGFCANAPFFHADTRALYVNAVEGVVRVSRDGGETWDDPGWPAGVRVFGIGAVAPRAIFRYDGLVLERSFDGTTFTTLSTGRYIIGLDAMRNGTAFASIGGNVERTTDGGATWTTLLPFSTQLLPVRVSVDPSDPDIIFVRLGLAYNPLANTGQYLVLRTLDGGITWSTTALAGLVTASPHPGGPTFDVPLTDSRLPLIGFDAFVAKWSPTGQEMFRTVLGGVGDDFASALSVAADGTVLVSGSTTSTDFPLARTEEHDSLIPPNGSLLAERHYRRFLTRLQPNGSGAIFSRVFGWSAAPVSLVAKSGTNGHAFGLACPGGGGAACQIEQYEANGHVVRVQTAPGAPLLIAVGSDGRLLLAFDTASGGQSLDVVVQTVIHDPLAADLDGDTLPDAWESSFGLDPTRGGGIVDGAASDPDGDGLSNLAELAAGTHPRGFSTRLLAEGVVNSFFETQLALFNPGHVSAIALLRIQPQGQAERSLRVTVPAATRVTVTSAQLAALTTAPFSTVIEADTPIVVDRTVTWDASGYGAHAETAGAAASTTWYLAEGSTSGSFSLFYLLQNPNATATTATVRYLRPGGLAPIERAYALPGRSRTTIAVDGEGPELAATDVSAVITAPDPILVERAMYADKPGQPFAAGHGAAGVTAPARSWFLGEGATGPFFDLFVLLANPHTTPAQATLTYLLTDGRTFTKGYTVPGNGRVTVWVDDEQLPAGSGQKPLANVAVSTTIAASLPIVVERTMWWPGPELSADFWTEAHNSPGATQAGQEWTLAEGEVGGPRHAETYILIANVAPTAGQVLVTVYFEDGTSVARTFAVAATSRTNVSMSQAFPEAAGRRFSANVETLGPGAIVVERSIYTSTNGQVWNAGTNSLAVRRR